jgi:hypothetical protein
LPFLSSSPGRDLLSSFSLYFVAVTNSFAIFSQEIACQAPKPPKRLKQNKIELAFSFAPFAILDI